MGWGHRRRTVSTTRRDYTVFLVVEVLDFLSLTSESRRGLITTLEPVPRTRDLGVKEGDILPF